MSTRMLSGLMLLLAAAAWRAPVISGSQAPATAPAGPKWEYRVLRLDTAQCYNDGSLNRAGQEGWELVSFMPVSVSFAPQDAQGSLLIRPSATGPGAQNNPPTADSFSGTMTIKLSPAHADACLAVFKRPTRPSPGQPQQQEK